MVGLVAVAAGGLTGCAPDPEPPQDVARAFYDAVLAGDGETACAWLLPDVAETVAEDEGAPCGEALTTGELGAELRERGADPAVHDATVAGRQAQVRLGGDTLFLALSGTSWVITGAACSPEPDQPYDCEVAL